MPNVFSVPMGASGSPVYPVLLKGDDPVNLDACRTFLRSFVSMKAGYLLHQDFNDVTNMIPKEATCAWEEFLVNKRRSSGVKTEAKLQSPSLTEEEDEFISSGGAGFSTPSKPSSWEDPLALGSSMSGPESALWDRRYMDPMTDKVESQEKHTLRYQLWSIVELMFVHHKHLLTPRADFYVLFTKLMAMGGKGVYQRTFDALRSMCALSKPPSMSMSTYQSMVTRTRNELSRLPVEFAIPPKLFQLCVVKGVESDPALAVTYAWLRRRLFELDLDSVLAELTEAGGRSTIGGQVQNLKVNAAQVPAARRDKVRKKRPCFAWRDYGTCKNGDRCPYSHDFSRVPSAHSTGTPSVGKPGSCYECRGAHSIDECPLFKARMDSMRQAEIKAMAARLSPAQLSAQRVAGQAHALGFDPTLAAAIQAPSNPGASAAAGED